VHRNRARVAKDVAVETTFGGVDARMRGEDLVEVPGVAVLGDDRARVFSAAGRFISAAMWKQKRSESPTISITSLATICGFRNEPPTTTHAAQPVWTLIPIARCTKTILSALPCGTATRSINARPWKRTSPYVRRIASRG